MSKQQPVTRRRTLDAAAATAQRSKPAQVPNTGNRRKLTSVPLSPVEAAEHPEDMVMVNVPKAFRLTLDHHHYVDYKQGAHNMPREHFENWWSKANGVTLA